MQRLKEPFGKAGLIVAVVALVFAMLGGAFAATSSKRHHKKKGGTVVLVKKLSKRYSKAYSKAFSKRFSTAGPAGPQGPAGANGKDGKDGQDGLNGLDGEDGTSGTSGSNGTSVTNTEFSGAEGTCTEGGSKLVGSSTTYACNGVKGADGANGEDGETGFTETLPAGKTETGAWSFGKVVAAAVPTEYPPFEEPLYVPISFSIPLAAPIGETNVHYLKVGEGETTECPGTAAEPKAQEGHLCVYTGGESTGQKFINFGINDPGSPVLVNGAAATGALVQMLVVEEKAFAAGTFAVTAPTP